jgi:hypothetical protein
MRGGVVSTEILAAILGRDAIERMPPDELQAMLKEVDGAILRDRTLMERLSDVVAAAATNRTRPDSTRSA